MGRVSDHIILATTSKKEGKKAVKPNGAAMLKSPRKNTATWQISVWQNTLLLLGQKTHKQRNFIIINAILGIFIFCVATQIIPHVSVAQFPILVT